MDKRVAKHSVFFLTLFFLATAVLLAQVNATGSLTGTVTDQQGGVILGAEVSAKNDHTGSEYTAATNEIGVWEISSLPTGSYTVSVTAHAFRTSTFGKIKVETGTTVTVDSILQVGLADEVTITASRYKQEVTNAPATVSVLSSRAIEALPSHNVADLLRAVPGINVIRTSAYHFSVRGRAAAGMYTDAQLALVDGRTIYDDHLGSVYWNAVPADLDEVKQVEVIRGPASAVWGPYAMNGVINIITTPPREMLGSSFTLGIGTFDRSGGTAESSTGSLYYAKAAHAQALNDRWAYKITGGVYTQDAFARPQGAMPNDWQTPYPIYANKGTTNPKIDARVDYDYPDGKQHFTFGGGFVSNSGIVHTGFGPLDCNPCLAGYGKVDYTRGALRITTYVNAGDADAPFQMFLGPTGQPVQWRGDTQTYDIGFSNFHLHQAKHLISYGGNFRHIHFDHSAMPGVTGRNEGGAYFQDEFFISDHFRWVFGVRIDKFDNLKGAVFSPRTTLMVKPASSHTFRVSYNRAYVAPPPIQNYMKITAMFPIDLGGGNYYSYPVRFEGNPDLKEESLNAYEVGYTVTVADGRANLGAAFYINDGKGRFYYYVSDIYTSQNPPPGWPLEPYVLDYLKAYYGIELPELLVAGNLGKARDKGLELSAEVQISRFIDGYANYSWQARPVSKDYDISLRNQPPTNRFNAGMNLGYRCYFGSADVGYVGSAFWNDVIHESYSGTTKAYTNINLSGGMRWGEAGKYIAMVKISNLANTTIQNHIFGDILKRQISAEFKMRF
jgi:outer membrane receptor protein involved in Fe transport